MLNYLCIHTKVLHSGLSNKKRTKLVKEFNNKKSSLRAIVLMFNIESQGTNLSKDYDRILVATGAVNTSLEIQVWVRVIRVAITPIHHM